MATIKRYAINGRRALCTATETTVYTAGITSSDLAGDITVQTQDVLAVIDKLLATAGTCKDNLLNATITLCNIDADYGAFNAVWDAWIVDGSEPSRSVSQGKLAVPEYKVKISVVAAL